MSAGIEQESVDKKETISLDDLVCESSVAISMTIKGRPRKSVRLRKGHKIFVTVEPGSYSYVEGKVFCRSDEGGCIVIAQGMTYRV